MSEFGFKTFQIIFPTFSAVHDTFGVSFSQSIPLLVFLDKTTDFRQDFLILESIT
jgi:hypothetical protein